MAVVPALDIRQQVAVGAYRPHLFRQAGRAVNHHLERRAASDLLYMYLLVLLSNTPASVSASALSACLI